MMSFHVDVIPNRRGRDTVLLRESWREGGTVRHRTLGNLTDLPAAAIEGIRAVLRGARTVDAIDRHIEVCRSLPHGHVTAALDFARRLGMERLLDRRPGRVRSLALAAILCRLIAPDSKLATARQLSDATASTSLGTVLGLGEVAGNEMLDMLDWLLKRQRRIERSLARKHLAGATMLLYDVTSSCLEGRQCPLAAFGHNRDGKAGKRQIVFGLLCAPDGCPLAVEVFDGNTADPSTVASQVGKIRNGFGIDRIALVGDRGMITTARIREDLQPAGFDWISALKSTDIRKLLRDGDGPGTAPLAPGRPAPDQVAEIVSPDFPGERLIVCRNPRLQRERARKREDLLNAAERKLAAIGTSVGNGRLRGADAIGRRVGRDLATGKVGKHFDIEITDAGITWQRREDAIRDEARLDGIHVIRTSLPQESIGCDQAVRSYKSLATVERAFRIAKSRLRVRPIHVHTEDHVRGHVFLCMLAAHLEFHMRRKLAPILFEDDDREAAEAQRATPVETAQTSESARRKAADKSTADGLPVHSFTTLMQDLATLCLNRTSFKSSPEARFDIATAPTPVQQRALDLLRS